MPTFGCLPSGGGRSVTLACPIPEKLRSTVELDLQRSKGNDLSGCTAPLALSVPGRRMQSARRDRRLGLGFTWTETSIASCKISHPTSGYLHETYEAVKSVEFRKTDMSNHLRSFIITSSSNQHAIRNKSKEKASNNDRVYAKTRLNPLRSCSSPPANGSSRDWGRSRPCESNRSGRSIVESESDSPA